MPELIRPSRRGFFGLFGGLIAAPAIIKFDSLMKVATVPPLITTLYNPTTETVWVNGQFMLPLEVLEKNDNIVQRLVARYDMWDLRNPQTIVPLSWFDQDGKLIEVSPNANL